MIELGPQPRWRHRQKCFASSHNHRRNYNQISKQITPRTVRKPNSMESRCHIHPDGRRCVVVKTARNTVWHGEAAAAVEWMVPHSYVVDKNQEGYLGREQSQPLARHTAQGASTWKINPHYLWL